MNYRVKENIVVIISVSLITIAVVTLFVFLNADEDLIPNQWILEMALFFISFLIFIIPYFFERRDFSLADSSVKDSKVRIQNKTKRIRVDLSKCTLECNSSYERVQRNNPENIHNTWEGIVPSKNVVTNI